MIKRETAAFWAIVALAFILRAAFLSALNDNPNRALTPDSIGYLQAAENIVSHASFSLSSSPPFVPETVRTPGYPLFLAAFCRNFGRPNIRAVLWVQALLGALTCGLVYLTALWLWHNEVAALAAGVGLAVDVVTILHAGLIGTETLYVSGFTAAFLLLVRAFSFGPGVGLWWAFSGLGFGLISLVRPAGLYYSLFAAAVIAFVWRKELRRLSLLMIFLFSSLIAPIAWMTRNRAAVGIWTFSSIQGLNFVIRAADIKMEISGLGHDQALEQTRQDIKKSHPEDFVSLAEEAFYSEHWAFQFIACHPLAYASLIIKDVVKMMGGHGMEIGAWLLLKDSLYDPLRPGQVSAGHFQGTKDLFRRHAILGLFFMGYVLFLVAVYWLAGKGFLAAWRSDQTAEALLGVTPIAYFIAITVAVTMAYYRFRLPMMPAIFILAGRGVQSLGKR
jgi:4-amino-4-deoxy-L-arabinose transferase-like glycosyltransferase